MLDLDDTAVAHELVQKFRQFADLSFPGARMKATRDSFVVMLRDDVNSFMREGIRNWVRDTLDQMARRPRPT